MEFALADGKSFHPDNSTLVLPALSIGNVGQLAVDLLVSSTGAERVAYLDDPSILPCVGNNAYRLSPAGELALPLEAYDSPSNKLTFVQQRSPVVKGRMLDFAKNVAEFAASLGKKHIVILSSLDSGIRKRIHASSDLQMYYISSASAGGDDEECERLGWKRLEEYDPSQRRWLHLHSLAEGTSSPDPAIFDDDLDDGDYCPSLPFAALFCFCKAKGLKVTCVLCYCSEGDNISDSLQLVTAAGRFLGLDLGKFPGSQGGGWIIPCSWQNLYGPPPDLSIF
ncbi:clast3-like protein [Wolffia australiana]